MLLTKENLSTKNDPNSIMAMVLMTALKELNLIGQEQELLEKGINISFKVNEKEVDFKKVLDSFWSVYEANVAEKVDEILYKTEKETKGNFSHLPDGTILKISYYGQTSYGGVTNNSNYAVVINGKLYRTNKTATSLYGFIYSLENKIPRNQKSTSSSVIASKENTKFVCSVKSLPERARVEIRGKVEIPEKYEPVINE